MRLCLWLFAILITSSMFLVHSSYEERELFYELENLKREALILKEEINRLETEEQKLSQKLNLMEKSLDKGMILADPATTIYVNDLK